MSAGIVDKRVGKWKCGHSGDGHVRSSYALRLHIIAYWPDRVGWGKIGPGLGKRRISACSLLNLNSVLPGSGCVPGTELLVLAVLGSVAVLVVVAEGRELEVRPPLLAWRSPLDVVEDAGLRVRAGCDAVVASVGRSRLRVSFGVGGWKILYVRGISL